MAFSDPIDTRPSTEVVSAEMEADQTLAPEPAATTPPGPESDLGEAVLEKRVALPKPDVNNITVLTGNLPNEPILPWHRFDSPWLEKDSTNDEILPETSPAPALEAAGEQLTLALEGVSTSEDDPAPAKDKPDNGEIGV